MNARARSSKGCNERARVHKKERAFITKSARVHKKKARVHNPVIARSCAFIGAFIRKKRAFIRKKRAFIRQKLEF